MEKEMEWYCPNCGKKVNADTEVCDDICEDGVPCNTRFEPVTEEPEKKKRKLKEAV